MKWPWTKPDDIDDGDSDPIVIEQIDRLRSRIEKLEAKPSLRLEPFDIHDIAEQVIQHYDLKKPSVLYQKWLEDKTLANIIAEIEKHTRVPDDVRKEVIAFTTRIEEKLVVHEADRKNLYSALASLFGKQSFEEVMTEAKEKETVA